MSEYLFGCGEGWLSKKAAKIAAKNGATLVNHSDPQCTCGYGCAPFKCESSRRHWFTAKNLGEPFNSRLAEAIEKAL